MSRTWIDLIRAERDHPERERERWCGGCALWRLAAGTVETEGGREGADAREVRDVGAEREAAAGSEAAAPDTGTATNTGWGVRSGARSKCNLDSLAPPPILPRSAR
ncbi:hypothetical protein [Leifsonia sp. EB34]|uniref:hypothetical protein n=1 Tax=Leifsonia sp. EB34 TaxID=3156303 RepID=UPI003518DAFC